MFASLFLPRSKLRVYSMTRQKDLVNVFVKTQNGAIVYRPSETKCQCGVDREICRNYKAHGYDCAGLRFDDGRFLQAPFGLKIAGYAIGPHFT